MSNLNDRKSTALVIVDMQNGVIEKAYKRDSVIEVINNLVIKARTASAPIIWVQHSGEGLIEETEAWQVVAELHREPTDLTIRKRHGDAFEETNLEQELARLNVRRLLITGAQTDACIRSTLHGSFVRGYDTTLISDAHTTEDLTSFGLPTPEKLIDFTNTYWTWQSGPGRIAEVKKGAEISFNN